MSPEDQKPETKRGVGHVSIRSLLSDDVFNLSSDISLAPAVDQNKLGKWYARFNYNGLDSEGRWTMHYLVGKLDNAIKKAADLRSEGKSDLADSLIEKVRIIQDPNFSTQTDLNDIFQATHGNLDMCLAFLGFKRDSKVKSWFDFIIRTWGEQPVYNFK